MGVVFFKSANSKKIKGFLRPRNHIWVLIADVIKYFLIAPLKNQVVIILRCSK